MACYQVHAPGAACGKWGVGGQGPEFSRPLPSSSIGQNFIQMAKPKLLGHGKYSLHCGWLCVQLKFRGFNTVEEWKMVNGRPLAFFATIDDFI